MADTAPPPNESKPQRDARLRRERRNAKIQAEGSSRLSKITSLSGRPAAAEAELNRTPPSRSPGPQARQNGSARTQQGGSGADDPAEVDISSMFQRPPGAQEGVGQQELFRRMMRAGGEEEPGREGGEAGEDDPIMRMMQQMLGGVGGTDGQDGPPGLPPGLVSMLGGGAPQQETAQVSNSDTLWRLLHGMLALLLALYAALYLSFTGSSLSRSEYFTAPTGQRLFYLFATVELLLQGTRYLLDKGRPPPSGILGKIGQFLPEPYAGYVRLVSRYGVIYTAVVSDALVVVFVLGMVAWVRGEAGA